MAIDPNISLQAGKFAQPDYGNAMKLGIDLQAAAMRPEQIQQEISASKTNQAKTAAEIPGVEAASSTAVRDLAVKQWFGIHLNEMLQPASENGAGSNGGPPQINYVKAAAMAAAAGYADKIDDLVTPFIKSTQSSISQANSQQDLNEKRLKAGKDVAGFVAQYVKGAAKGNKLAAYNTARSNAMDKFGPDVVSINMPTITSDNDLASWVDSTSHSTMTEKEHQELNIQKETLKNATEEVAIQNRNQRMTAEQNNVAATGDLNAADMYRKGAMSVDDWGDNVLSGLTKGGNWTNKQWETYVSANPALTPTFQAIQRHNLDNPGDELSLSSPPEAIKASLLRDATYRNATANSHSAVARAGGSSSIPGAPVARGVTQGNPRGTPQGQASGKAPGKQTVAVVGPDGKMVRVYQEELQNALAAGYKQVK